MKINKILISLFILTVTACGVFNSLGDFSKLKFRLSSADNITLGGININNKIRFTDLTAQEIEKLYKFVYDEKLPLSFDLYVSALNPNTGKDNLPPADIRLKSFPFKLFVDEKETISGNITNDVLITAGESQKEFVINISVDLWNFYKGNNFNNTVEPVLKYGGKEGITSHIKLVAKPVIETPAGDYEYPEEITVVDYQFN